MSHNHNHETPESHAAYAVQSYSRGKDRNLKGFEEVPNDHGTWQFEYSLNTLCRLVCSLCQDGTVRCKMTGMADVTSRIFRWWAWLIMGKQHVISMSHVIILIYVRHF